MRIPSGFWKYFDNPIVQGMVFALWGVPIYVFLKWVPEWLIRYLSWEIPPVSPADQQLVGSFIEWFGAPYGLILALVLVSVWSQFDTTERAYDREGDTVLTLYNTFHFISNKSLKIEASQKIKAYITSVRNSQLGKSRVRKEADKSVIDDEEGLLKDIRKNIKELLESREDRDLAIKLIDVLNKLIDYRGDRKSYERQRLPGPIRGLSVAASLAWLIPFYSLKFTSPLIGPLLIVAVTLVVVSLILVIEDLDNPTEGAWRVMLESWNKLEEEIERENNLLGADDTFNSNP